MKKVFLECLAAIAGLSLLVGEAMEPAPAAAKGKDAPSDEFPGQRRGGGTHFRERIERAKLLGKLPGLRRMAVKLREPRSSSVLAQYTPPDNSQGSGGSSTGGGIRAGEKPGPTQTPPPLKEAAPSDEFPGQRRGGGTH